MSTSAYTSNAPISAPSFTGSLSPAFIGDASGLTLGSSTGYIVTTNGSNQLAVEQYVTAAQGGLGTNVGSLTAGVLTTSSGVTSTVAYGTSGAANSLLQMNGSGNISISGSVTAGSFIGNGSGLTNLTVSGSEITLNNANYVAITNGSSQLTTEQYLATTRGGFGVNPTSGLSSTTSAGSAIVLSGGSLATMSYATAATASTLVQRDANGAITTSTLISSPNANGQTSTQSSYVQTTNATATALFTLATTSGTTSGSKGTVYAISALIAAGDGSGDVNSAIFTLDFKAKNVYNGTLHVVTVSNPIQIKSTIDNSFGLSNSSITVTASGQNVLLQVTGIAATTINWTGSYTIVQTIY